MLPRFLLRRVRFSGPGIQPFQKQITGPLKRTLLVVSILLIAQHALAGDFRTEPPSVAQAILPLPKAEKLATPSMPALLGYTRRILHLHDGHTLAVLSYANAAKANWLFLIDSRDLSSKRYDIPNNDIGSHSAALGSDGNIYLMPYQTGRGYRFDVTKRAFEQLAVQNIPSDEFTWDAIGSTDGCIYFGTYPNACLGRYEIATKKWTVWPHVVPKATYVTDFEAEEGGRVVARAWGEGSQWIEIDRKAAGPSIITRYIPPTPPSPPPAPGESGWQKTIKVNDRHFGIAARSGKFYEQNTLRGDPQAPAQAWYLEQADNAIIGISHFGTLFRFDLATNAFTRGQVDNEAPGANHLMFLEAVTPDCVIGGNYSQQNLFAINPKTGELHSSKGYSVRISGEACCAAAVEGKAYIGIYIHSLIAEYDPKQPFAFDQNPKVLADLFPEDHQTRPIDAITDGSHVFISNEGNYGTLGGALAVVTPKTGEVKVYPQLVQDQNLNTMVYDPKSKCVWGGTDRWGEMHSVAPTQPSAMLWGFNPATGKRVATKTPWPGADVVRVIGSPADGFILATNGAEATLIATSDLKALWGKQWPIEGSKLRRGRDGASYALSNGVLYRWDLAENSLVPVASAPGCMFFTEASAGLWIVGDQTTIYRVKVGPED